MELAYAMHTEVGNGCIGARANSWLVALERKLENGEVIEATRMLRPIHLRTLTEAVRTGSFAETARLLGYTTSAVSQQIAMLERAVGAQLFERSARSVRPTAIAERLALLSRDALAALSELEREVQALTLGDAGTLRLASFATANTCCSVGVAEAWRGVAV